MSRPVSAPLQALKVWDLPLRLFHWLLAATIVAAVIAVQIGGSMMPWHGRAGLCAIALVVFRLVWGLLGPRNARFTSFIKGPTAIRSYLQGRWQGVGHNPLGALSVVALLLLVAAQAGTGLFCNDDIGFQGPLADWVGKDRSDFLGGIHEALSKLLFALIALHLAAIVFYARVKRHNLVQPMITGWDQVAPDLARANADAARLGLFRTLLALIVALALAALAVYAASGAFLPPAPPPPSAPAGAPASSAPTW